jgi:hypothetical protein
MVDSVAASVERGNTHGHQLALAPRQWSGPVHELAIELQVLAHHGRVHGMNLDDVVFIVDALVLL